MNDVGHPEELPTVLSLCTGYGGIERGLELAGLKHRVLAHVEIEAFAVANLVNKMEEGRLDAAPIWTNLKTLPLDCFRDRVSILTSGYPCQPFSAAGKRAGKDDPRHLWPYILDIIKAVRPVRCFFENVEGHISLGLREVIEDLEGLGYSTAWGIFSAVEVGAPHQRKRVYILGNTAEQGLAFRQGQKVTVDGPCEKQKPERSSAAHGDVANASGAGSRDYLGSTANERRPASQDRREALRQGDREERTVRADPTSKDEGTIMANADGAGLETLRNQSGAERQAEFVGESGQLGNAQHDGSSSSEIRGGVDATGNNDSKGTNEASQSEGTGRSYGGSDLREELADSDNSRCEQSNEEAPRQSPEQPYSGSVQRDTTNANGERLEGGLHRSIVDQEGRQEQEIRWSTQRSERGGGDRHHQGSFEPGLGRGFDGAESWLNGSWELGIPRVNTEAVDNRVDRLRLLGNGVVPQTAAKAWLALSEELDDRS